MLRSMTLLVRTELSGELLTASLCVGELRCSSCKLHGEGRGEGRVKVCEHEEDGDGVKYPCMTYRGVSEVAL